MTGGTSPITQEVLQGLEGLESSEMQNMRTRHNERCSVSQNMPTVQSISLSSSTGGLQFKLVVLVLEVGEIRSVLQR